MRDLTRSEHEELIRLLGLVIANGRGAMAADHLPRLARYEVMMFVHAAENVLEALEMDLENQKG